MAERLVAALRVFLLGCVVLALLLPLSAAAADVQNGWLLDVTVSTVTPVLGEPILAVATLRYEGESPFIGYASFGRSTFLYVTAAGLRLGGSPWKLALAGPQDELPTAKGITYAPGFSRLSEPVLMLYDSGAFSYIFGKPGRGEVYVYADIWRGTGIDTYRPETLRSRPVPITVLGPPAGESAALSLWKGEAQARVFLTGEENERAEADLKELAEEYPSSVYAKYALMALARAKQGQRARLARIGAAPPERKQELARMVSDEVALLEQVVDRYGEFHLLPVVLDRLLQASQWLPDEERPAKVRKYAEMQLGQKQAPEVYRTRAEQALQALSRKGL